MHLTDTGLAAWLTGSDARRLQADRERLGALLESFVAAEIRKQLGWSSVDARLSHYRSHDGTEVDLILEDRSGAMVGIEVKASATVRAEDLRGLRRLAERTGERWVRGVLLYLGRDWVPFGERLDVLPVSALWQDTRLEPAPLPDWVGTLEGPGGPYAARDGAVLDASWADSMDPREA